MSMVLSGPTEGLENKRVEVIETVQAGLANFCLRALKVFLKVYKSELDGKVYAHYYLLDLCPLIEFMTI